MAAAFAAAAALWIWSGTAAADRLEAVGTFEWSTEVVAGLSGLEVSEDGTRFHAVGDRGWLLTGRFERSEGRIVGLTPDRLVPILGNDGLPVAARRAGDWSDAEGLAMAPDGTYWISFERWAHVAHYASPDAAGTWIRDHPSFRELRDNRQLEALALDSDGTLYAFPEEPLGPGFPIYRLAGEGWVVDGHISRRNRFAIVGADFAADGWLYLLERKLALGVFWQSRIRRLRIETPTEDEILWTSGRGEYNNLEGLAVWPAPDGLRITLVSDTNQVKDEAAQFVELRLMEESGLPDTPGPSPGPSRD